MENRHSTGFVPFIILMFVLCPFVSAQPDWQFENNLEGSQNGWSVSTAGDVNGDGYADVLSGAWEANGKGEVYLHLGSDTGLAAEMAIIFEGLSPNAKMGTSLSSGDFNKDGFGDFVMGASGHSGGGAAYVYYGSSEGITTTAADWETRGESTNAEYGWSVSGAGDVNGDGFDDLIVSSTKEANRGKVYMYLGSENGLSLTPDWTKDGSGGGSFGRSISTAGDVNNDGFDDILVGENGSGLAYVFLGSETGLADTALWIGEAEANGSAYGWYVSEAGDVNGDGFSDIIVGAYSLDGQGATYVYLGSESGPSKTYDWKTLGGQQGSLYGVSVSSAGDVDRDGYSDIMISAEGHDNGHDNEGRVYIFRGSETGLAKEADSIFEINSTNAYLGANVSQAGDVNGDGLDDMIIGAYRYSNGQNEEGETVVYHGWETEGTIAGVLPNKGLSELSKNILTPSQLENVLRKLKVGSKIYIYDVKGELIAGVHFSGTSFESWGGLLKGIPLGIYFVRILGTDFEISTRLMLAP